MVPVAARSRRRPLGQTDSGKRTCLRSPAASCASLPVTDFLFHICLSCRSAPQIAVDFRLPEGTDASFNIDHLKHEILPSKSTVLVLPTRIEIRLRKKEPGIKWTSIEAKDELAEEKAKAAQEAYIEELNGSFHTVFSSWLRANDTIIENACVNPVAIQLMSDLHLEFHLRPITGHSGPGYQVFDFPVSATNLALLGNIGLTTQPGLFEFFHRQLLRFDRIFFVLGNHEGYNSTYASALHLSHILLNVTLRSRMLRERELKSLYAGWIKTEQLASN